MGGGSLLNGQNLLSVTKTVKSYLLMIPSGKDCSDITWNQKQIKILNCYLVTLQAPWTVCLFFVVYVFFQFNNDLAMVIVTDRSLNHFDDCAAEYVWRRVYLFFLGTQ